MAEKTMSALDWAFALREKPGLADGCEWDKFETETVDYYGNPLSGNAWHCLLMKQPQFASRCSWSFAKDWDDVGDKKHRGFSRWYWVVLLNEHPEFKDKCDWSAFDGYDISMLADVIDVDKLDVIHWSRLKGADWGRLLAKWPDLSERCDFSTFDGTDWVKALIELEALKDRCDWKKLSKDDWQRLLAVRPEFEKELKEHAAYKLADIKVDEWDPL